MGRPGTRALGGEGPAHGEESEPACLASTRLSVPSGDSRQPTAGGRGLAAGGRWRQTVGAVSGLWSWNLGEVKPVCRAGGAGGKMDMWWFRSVVADRFR